MEERNPAHLQSIVSHAATWSFADDFALLQWLRQISQNLQNRVQRTKSNLLNLNHSVNCTNVALDNVANDLTALQFGKQFVENRVQDDDEVSSTSVEQHMESERSNTNSSGAIFDVFLKNNMEILSKFSSRRNSHLNLNDFAEDNDISYNPLINPYDERSLPHIIYSKEWNQDLHIGILSKKHANQTDIDISDTFSRSTINASDDSTEDDFFVGDNSPSISENQQYDEKDDNNAGVPAATSKSIKSEILYSNTQKHENILKECNNSTNLLFMDKTNDTASSKSPITVSNVNIRPTNLFDDNDFQSFINELNTKVQPKKSDNNITKEMKTESAKYVDIFSNNFDKSAQQPLPSISLFDEDDDNDDDFFKSLTKNVNENDPNSSNISKTFGRKVLKTSTANSNETPQNELPNRIIERNRQFVFASSTIDCNVQKAHESITKLIQNRENSEDKEKINRTQSETKLENRIPSQVDQEKTPRAFVTNNEQNKENIKNLSSGTQNRILNEVYQEQTADAFVNCDEQDKEKIKNLSTETESKKGTPIEVDLEQTAEIFVINNEQDKEKIKSLPSGNQSETKSEHTILKEVDQEQTLETFVPNSKANDGSEFNIQENRVLDPILKWNADSNYSYKQMENSFHIFPNEPPDDTDFFDSTDKSKENTNYVLENEPYYEYDSSSCFDVKRDQHNPPNSQLTQNTDNIFYDDFNETLLALRPAGALTSTNTNYYSVNHEPPTLDDKCNNTTHSNTNESREPRISSNLLRDIDLKQNLEINISKQRDAIRSTFDQHSNTVDIFSDTTNRSYILPNVNKNRVKPSSLRKPPTKRLLSQFESNSVNDGDCPILKTSERIENNITNSLTDKETATITEKFTVTSDKPVTTEKTYHPLMQSNDDDPIKISLSSKLISAFDSDDSDDFDDLFPKKPTRAGT